MINLRKALTALLKEHHPDVLINTENKSRVHFQSANDDTPFPYIIYNFSNAFDNEQQEVFVLDIDVWDNNGDSTPIETLASLLYKKLHYHDYIDDQIQFSIYRSNRIPELDEKELGLKRRKLIFQLRYFDRRLFE